MWVLAGGSNLEGRRVLGEGASSPGLHREVEKRVVMGHWAQIPAKEGVPSQWRGHQLAWFPDQGLAGQLVTDLEEIP